MATKRALGTEVPGDTVCLLDYIPADKRHHRITSITMEVYLGNFDSEPGIIPEEVYKQDFDAYKKSIEDKPEEDRKYLEGVWLDQNTRGVEFWLTSSIEKINKFYRIKAGDFSSGSVYGGRVDKWWYAQFKSASLKNRNVYYPEETDYFSSADLAEMRIETRRSNGTVEIVKHKITNITYSTAAVAPVVKIPDITRIWIHQDFRIQPYLDRIEGLAEQYVILSTKARYRPYGSSGNYTLCVSDIIPKGSLEPSSQYELSCECTVPDYPTKVYPSGGVVHPYTNGLPIGLISGVANGFINSDAITEISQNIVPNPGETDCPEWEIIEYTTYWREVGTQTWQSQNGNYIPKYDPETGKGTQYGKDYEIYQHYKLDPIRYEIDSQVSKYSSKDSEPTAECVYPVSGIVYGSARLQWNYINNRSKQQYAYDLEISDDNGETWIRLVTKNITRDQFYIYNHGKNATLKWRVRVYNWNPSDEPSKWEEAQYSNAFPPAQPVIDSVNTTGLPSFGWSADTQYMYSIEIYSITTSSSERENSTLEYSIDMVPSKVSLHNMVKYLEPGLYKVRVRTFTAQMLESPWSDDARFYIYRPDDSISLDYYHDEEGTHITIKDSKYNKYYILRDGVPIAKVYGSDFLDRYCYGLHTYTVRGILYDGSFVDESFTIDCSHSFSTLTDLNGKVYDIHLHLGSELSIRKKKSVDNIAVKYLAFKKPVYYIGTIEERSWDIECTQEVPIGEVLFYRNNKGDHAWVIVTSISTTYGWLGYDTNSYTITECDYSEEIAYD